MAEKATGAPEEEKKKAGERRPAEKSEGRKRIDKPDESGKGEEAKVDESNEAQKVEEKPKEPTKPEKTKPEGKGDGAEKPKNGDKKSEPVDDSPYLRNRVDTVLEEDKVPKKPAGHIEREKNYSRCEEIASLVQKIRTGEWEASERSKRLEQRYGSGILRNFKAFLGGEQDYSAAISPDTGTLSPDYAREILRRVTRVGVATAETAAVMGVIALLTGGTGVAIGGALFGGAIGRGIVEAYRGFSGKERAMREELEMARIRYYAKARELADRIGPEDPPADSTAEAASEYLRGRVQTVKDLVNFVFASEQHGVSIERDARGWVYSRTEVHGEPHPPGEEGEAMPGGPRGRTLNTGTEVYQPSDVAPNAKTIDDMEKEFEAHRKKWDWIGIGAGAAGGILGGLTSVLSAKGEIVKTLSTKLASGETVRLDIDGNGIYHGVQKASHAMVGMLDKAKEYVWHMANANELFSAMADRSTDVIVSGQQFGSRVLGVTGAELAKTINAEAWKQVVGTTWQTAVKNCAPVVMGLLAHTIGKSLAEKSKERHFAETRESMKQEQEILRRRFKPEDEVGRVKAEARRMRKPFPAPGQDWIYEEGGGWHHVRIESIDDSDPDDILVSVEDFGTDEEFSEIKLMPLDVFLRGSARRVVARKEGDFAFPKKKISPVTATVVPGVIGSSETSRLLRPEERETREHEPGQRVLAINLSELAPNVYRAAFDDGTEGIVVNEGKPFTSAININLIINRVDTSPSGETIYAEEENPSSDEEVVHDDKKKQDENEIKTVKELEPGREIEAEFKHYIDDEEAIFVDIDGVGYKLTFDDGAPIGLQESGRYKFGITSIEDHNKYIVKAKYLGKAEIDEDEEKPVLAKEEASGVIEKAMSPGAKWIARVTEEKKSQGVALDVLIVGEAKDVWSNGEIELHDGDTTEIIGWDYEREAVRAEDKDGRIVEFRINDVKDIFKPEAAEGYSNDTEICRWVDQEIEKNIDNAKKAKKLDSPKGVEGKDDDAEPEADKKENVTNPEKAFEKGTAWIMRPLKPGEGAPEIPYSVMKSGREIPQERNNWIPNKNWKYFVENVNFEKRYIDFHARSDSSPVIRVQLESFIEIMQPHGVTLLEDEDDRKKAMNEILIYADGRLGDKALWRTNPRTSEAVPVGEKRIVSSAEDQRRPARVASFDVAEGNVEAESLGANQKALGDTLIGPDRALPAHEERGDERADRADLPQRRATDSATFEGRRKIGAETLKEGDALEINPNGIGSYSEGSGRPKPISELAKDWHTYKFLSFEDGTVEVEVDGARVITMPQAVFNNSFKASGDVEERIARDSVKEAFDKNTMTEDNRKALDDIDQNILELERRKGRKDLAKPGSDNYEGLAYADRSSNAGLSALKSTETSFDRRGDDRLSTADKSFEIANKNGETIEIKPGQTWMWMRTYNEKGQKVPLSMSIEEVHARNNEVAIKFIGHPTVTRPKNDWNGIFEYAKLAK
jgi:hypothetical protein